jgi:hypothetical protein
VLENAQFKAIAAVGVRSQLAGDRRDRRRRRRPHRHDPTTGNLFYDADGSGAVAPILFATLGNAPAMLGASDFAVI